jgi:uncharacterized protein YjbJ (UPF0337 family)
MGDRKQRVKGKAEDLMGRAKKKDGKTAGNRSQQVRGAAKELKGKARNAAGKASSSVKRGTR